MKNILIAILAIAALYYFKPGLFPWVGNDKSSAYDEAGNPKVVIFTFAGCGAPCNDALSLLKDKGIAFENVDLSENEENEKRLRSMDGGNTMPLTFVGDQRVEGFERTKLTHALAAAYGLEYLDPGQRDAIETHFEADGSPKLVMYATDWCPYCQKAREHFVENRIPYTEIDVEKSAEGERRYTALKASGYPLIYIGTKRIQGFDKQAIDKEVNAL